MPDRGEINNRDRAKQLRDYSGLCFGTITPTDIDGCIEYNNNAYVLIELKYADTSLPLGQEIALRRLTDDLEKSGKPTLCIIASHKQSDPDKDIDVAKTKPIKYRLKKKWIPLKNHAIITRTLIETFLDDITVEPEKLLKKIKPETLKTINMPITSFMTRTQFTKKEPG